MDAVARKGSKQVATRSITNGDAQCPRRRKGTNRAARTIEHCGLRYELQAAQSWIVWDRHGDTYLCTRCPGQEYPRYMLADEQGTPAPEGLVLRRQTTNEPLLGLGIGQLFRRAALLQRRVVNDDFLVDPPQHPAVRCCKGRRTKRCT